MPDKPKRASEYESHQVELVRATCLYVATKLGDLMDQLVVVGGLVPSLIIDQAKHSHVCGVEPVLPPDLLEVVGLRLLAFADDEDARIATPARLLPSQLPRLSLTWVVVPSHWPRPPHVRRSDKNGNAP